VQAPAAEPVEPPVAWDAKLPEAAPEVVNPAPEASAAPEAAPTKPAASGNRFVRALGKVFHRTPKRDADPVK
jgi:hypothetical protein